ncbi:translation machinery-associated protein-like protein [Eremomyces bilateralis CBS 781.70]|uniref:Translation machinery-associated protein 20 n=1 Tax=Eremomyces bilateralis CBS 781.70 TaxID=1392243 RepID=A0A6G1G8V9_9PEZI|nr:translation machinery-associated protein-like protein [Eremomyces bilateralis CBS 781.70]KAF1814366.1 translation machinery-associated protein-like protein [Eremomyces bilateralis CBS 781.70]
MFKKEIPPGTKSKVKSSVQRGIRSKAIETYPLLEPYMDEIMPKKEQLDMIKLPDRVTLYALSASPVVPLFWQHMDDPLIPHLRLVHRFPDCFHRIRIDRGAIRFVLSGAALMTPGATSPGGRLPEADGNGEEDYRYGTEELAPGTVVVVEAEGKENACMVGQLKVGTKEMKATKKGAAVEAGHYLGDGLWNLHLD